MQIRLKDGSVTTPSDEEVRAIRFLISIVTATPWPNLQACLIPHPEDIVTFDVDPGLSWVLIVEKEVSMNDRIWHYFPCTCSSSYRRYSKLCAVRDSQDCQKSAEVSL